MVNQGLHFEISKVWVVKKGLENKSLWRRLNSFKTDFITINYLITIMIIVILVYLESVDSDILVFEQKIRGKQTLSSE